MCRGPGRSGMGDPGISSGFAQFTPKIAQKRAIFGVPTAPNSLKTRFGALSHRGRNPPIYTVLNAAFLGHFWPNRDPPDLGVTVWHFLPPPPPSGPDTRTPQVRPIMGGEAYDRGPYDLTCGCNVQLLIFLYIYCRFLFYTFVARSLDKCKR
jgi:hypothetical protein